MEKKSGEKRSQSDRERETEKKKQVLWAPMLNSFLSFLFRSPSPCFHHNQSQHVKVGIVGGSDLVKISEQLGENSE